jgi:hypothetical protein
MVSDIFGMVITVALIPETSIFSTSASDLGAAAGLAAGVDSVLGAGMVEADPLRRCSKDSPFSPMMAMIPLTGTESFSLTPIYKRTPSS